MSKSESEAKHRGFIVGDLAGNEFLPLDEIIDPETEKNVKAKIKAKKNSDRFDDIVQSLRDERLGADVEQYAQARVDLGATAVYDVMV